MVSLEPEFQYKIALSIVIIMDFLYRTFMVRRIAEARQRKCYLEIFKLTVEHKVDYTVNRNGVFFNLTPLPEEVVRQIDEVLKRCEQQKRGVTGS